MYGKRYYISFFLLLMGLMAHAQQSNTEICVDFRLGATSIDSTYSNNAERLNQIVSFLHEIHKDSTLSIIEVGFCGAASPEGSYQLNKRLAQGRLASLEKFIRRKVEIPDSIITRNDSYIPWDYLYGQIKDSELPHREEVLSILKETPRLVGYTNGTHIDNRIVKLKELSNGQIWKQINQLFFKQMRNACAVFVVCRPKTIAEQTVSTPDSTVIVPTSKLHSTHTTESVPESASFPHSGIEEWKRHLYLKSNAIGWGMLIVNAAIEIDIDRHWSVTLPIYYSAWNYFTSTIKFRTLCFQPEIRYWLKEDNNGWFGGAHLGLAWYNYALDGQWRTQDHNRNTPSLGGGISAGYRMPISKNNRWKMEFVIGGGVYASHYDKFYNEPNGRLHNNYKKTFFGIDNVAISIAYQFNWKEEKK